MRDDGFLRLVADMRAAQKEYFKKRSKAMMIRAKDLEARVDRAIRRRFDAMTGDLFKEQKDGRD